ncbi:MAG TPA: cell envelope integrity protein TolA [Steroidobacter sp.]
MGGLVRNNWPYFLGALALHVVFAGIFALTMISFRREPPPVPLAIEAVVVDPSVLNRAPRPAEPEIRQERERAEAEERERAAEAERLRQQQEAERLQAERRAQEARQRELKQREEAERQRLAEERAMRERQEAERKRQEEERRQAEEAERKRLAEIKRKQQEEAERKRLAEIKRKQQEEAERRRQAEEARLQAAREEELRRQLEAEEGLMQARNSPAMAQYMAMIRQHVERRWIRPMSATPGLECEVKVTQSPSGVVLSAQVTRCNGDAAVRQSIETAVQRSSPLPLPPDPRLFDRNIVFIFKPAD